MFKLYDVDYQIKFLARNTVFSKMLFLRVLEYCFLIYLLAYFFVYHLFMRFAMLLHK